MVMSLEGIVKMTVGGRITIPKETRDKLGWVPGMRISVLRDGHRLVLELPGVPGGMKVLKRPSIFEEEK